MRDVFLFLYLKLYEFQGENSLLDWVVQSVYLSQLERQELCSPKCWQIQCLASSVFGMSSCLIYR